MTRVPDEMYSPSARGAPPGDAHGMQIERASWLNLLAEPALVRYGGRTIATPARHHLLICCGLVQRTLTAVVQRPVTLRLQDACSETASPCFAVRLTFDALPRAITISLDERAARCLIDALGSNLAGLRGRGTPSPAEYGMLQFIVLCALDQAFAASQSDHARGVVIDSWHAVDEGSGWVKYSEPVLLEYELAVCSEAGRVWIHADSHDALDALETAALVYRGKESEPMESSFDVSLALPPIDLSHEERAAMQVGDVLRTGRTDLSEATWEWPLVSSRGWRVGRAAVRSFSNTFLSLCTTPEVPTVHHTSNDNPDRVRIELSAGRAAIDSRQWERWASGDRLDLQLGSAPVALSIENARVGHGEFVAIEEEIGVRIIVLE